MSDYNCSGCGNLGYESKINSNRGNYDNSCSGKDDYASGMPDVFMSHYLDKNKKY